MAVTLLGNRIYSENANVYVDGILQSARTVSGTVCSVQLASYHSQKETTLLFRFWIFPLQLENYKWQTESFH